MFDTVGRRRIIPFTYRASGLLVGVSAWVFHQGLLTATTQTIFSCVILFLASAGGLLRVSEGERDFPLELRGQAIGFFFAIFAIFASLVGSGRDPGPLPAGCVVGAAIMFLGGAIAWCLAVYAERRPLEDVAPPSPTSRARSSGPPARPATPARQPGPTSASGMTRWWVAP